MLTFTIMKILKESEIIDNMKEPDIYNSIVLRIKELEKENKKLKKQINKAIKEIETRTDYEVRFKKLLDILKGSNKKWIMIN